MAWFLIIFGGLVEIFWVNGLKYSTTYAGYTFTILGICTSFVCMILATKKIEVSIAYSVFVGIGASGVVLGEILFFNAPFNYLQIALIMVLLICVIGLKLVSKESDKEDSKAISEISKTLNLDEIEEQIQAMQEQK